MDGRVRRHALRLANVIARTDECALAQAFLSAA